LGFLAVNPDGTLIASCSAKGHRIKIFSADGGDMLQELRRGSTSALLTSIIFHPNLNLIACCSNKASIHIYEIKKSIEKCIESKQFGFSQGDTTKNAEGENKKSR
jgi:WD40 repeat protein